MVDAALSRKLQSVYAVGRARWQLIILLVAAFVLIGGGWITVWAWSASKEAAPRTTSDQLLETTKGLEVTQQQAVNCSRPVTSSAVRDETAFRADHYAC